MRNFVLFTVLSFFILSCGSEKTATIDGDIGTQDSTSDNDNETIDSDSEIDVDADGKTPDSATDEMVDADVDPCEGFVAIDCDESISMCTAYNVVESCVTNECGKTLVKTECSDSQGCFGGKCIANSCADECVPGEEKDGKVCEYWNSIAKEWTVTDQANRLYDRFEEYQRWQQRDLLPFGGVADATYKTENLQEVVEYDGIGDSAIWTGTYLTAESIRFMVDRSQAALDNIRELVKTMHLFFNVSGHPGLLARYTYESSNRSANFKDMNCADDRVFCDVPYNGKNYDYCGHISRDQYQGLLMGYSFAYDALKGVDEQLRSIIRDDIVEFVGEIMTKRDVSVRFKYDNFPPEGVHVQNIELRFSVLSPNEMVAGGILITYCSKETADCESNMYGFQEFMPNIGILLHQLNSNLPNDIERPGSGMMLANIFNIAMQVTDGIPGYETPFNTFQTFYYTNDDQWGNITDWIEQMARFNYTFECGEKYYGININMEPMYNLLRLEKNETVRTAIFERVLKQKLWETVKTDKNVFFAYIYGSQGASDPNIVKNATEQFQGFVNAPHVDRPIDWRDDARYPHSTECSDQVDHSVSIDVADRGSADFIWQRNPFALYRAGRTNFVYAGVDYMLPYWMGRYYGYIQDDSEGKCFRWK